MVISADKIPAASSIVTGTETASPGSAERSGTLTVTSRSIAIAGTASPSTIAINIAHRQLELFGNRVIVKLLR